MSAQRQDSLREQMEDAVAWAENNGCYDAADWMRGRWRSDSERMLRYEGALRLTAGLSIPPDHSCTPDTACARCFAIFAARAALSPTDSTQKGHTDGDN